MGKKIRFSKIEFLKRFYFCGLMSLMLIMSACSGVKFSSPRSESKRTNNNIPPLLCSAGQPVGGNINYYPTSCLVPQALASSALGFQINNVHEAANKVFSLQANDPTGGTPANATLYIEIATYIAPDTIVVTATNSTGQTTELLNICNISTYSVPDPTTPRGQMRPYSDTILQFNVTLPKGTTALTFDYSGSTTPTYLGIWNLNEFSNSLFAPETNPFYGTGKLNQFRVQNGPPDRYNDNMDPRQSQPMCPNN